MWRREARLKYNLHPGWRSAPRLSADRWQARQKEPSYATHRVCSQPRREVCQRNANELGELPCQRVGEGLSRSTGPRLRISLQLVVDSNHICHLGDIEGRDIPRVLSH
jgi:hypothetical protein